MESLCLVLVLISNKIKKMYTNNEIEIIVNNCKNVQELYAVTACISFLIANSYQPKSIFIALITQLRFRELEKL